MCDTWWRAIDRRPVLQDPATQLEWLAGHSWNAAIAAANDKHWHAAAGLFTSTTAYCVAAPKPTTDHVTRQTVCSMTFAFLQMADWYGSGHPRSIIGLRSAALPMLRPPLRPTQSKLRQSPNHAFHPSPIEEHVSPQLAHSMAATAALEAHQQEPDRAGSLALAASALRGADRALTAQATRPGSIPDAKLATYLRLKVRTLWRVAMHTGCNAQCLRDKSLCTSVSCVHSA